MNEPFKVGMKGRARLECYNLSRLGNLTIKVMRVVGLKAYIAPFVRNYGTLAWDTGFGADFTNGSTTATTITIAKSNTAFATTTSLGSIGIPANGQGTIIASTTFDAFAPNTYVVIGMQGGIGNFSPTGICGATWTKVAPR